MRDPASGHGGEFTQPSTSLFSHFCNCWVTDTADAANSDADAATTIRAGSSRSRCVHVAATPVLHSQPGRLPPAPAAAPTATRVELTVRSSRSARVKVAHRPSREGKQSMGGK